MLQVKAQKLHCSCMLRFFIIAFFLVIVSCATKSPGKEVKRDSKEKMELSLIYFAKSVNGDYSINLRTNKFFDYHEKGQLYAGSYSIENSNLNLGFYNNYHPSDFSGKATIDTVKNEIVIIANNPSANRVLIISK